MRSFFSPSLHATGLHAQSVLIQKDVFEAMFANSSQGDLFFGRVILYMMCQKE